jgi:pyruvate dehydrogenase E2 component (dihydrolipoamide acetyltransferase)
MAHSVIMPKLGLTMTVGRVVHWLVEEGSEVTKGQILAEIESDKAIMQVESPADGILGRIVVPKGEEVPVGQVIAWVLEPGEAVPAEEPLAGVEVGGAEDGAVAAVEPETVAEAQPRTERILASPRARKLAKELGVDLSQVTGTGPKGRITGDDVSAFAMAPPDKRVKASPLARKLAREAGLDLTAVQGTGPGGRITSEDIQRALAAQRPPTPPVLKAKPAEMVALTGIRRTIAERMSASHTTTARVTLFTEVDATSLVGWRERLKAKALDQGAEPPCYNDLLIKIVATALREFPYMNASLTDDGIQQWSQVNVGLAIDTERGLIVPVIRDADRKGVWAIAQDVRSLVARARDGTIMPDELHGGTFTITNLGMYGVDGFAPIINLPECAILGVGRIVTKPVVWEGQICARQRMTLSLTFDHRIVDGAPAARFLQRVAQLIEEPYLMM